MSTVARPSLPIEERTTVFLLDDQEIVLAGLRDLLESSERFVVVAESCSCADAMSRFSTSPASVAVLDVQLPDGTGIEVCRDIRSAYPATRCMMLTAFSDDEAHVEAMLAGASGLVLKRARGQELMNAIERVAAGHQLIDPEASRLMAARLRGVGADPDPLLGALTPLERRVLGLVAEGLTNRQIARSLVLGERTVKNYVSSILLKLGTGNRTAAALMAVRAGEGS